MPVFNDGVDPRGGGMDHHMVHGDSWPWTNNEPGGHIGVGGIAGGYFPQAASNGLLPVPPMAESAAGLDFRHHHPHPHSNHSRHHSRGGSEPIPGFDPREIMMANPSSMIDHRNSNDHLSSATNISRMSIGRWPGHGQRDHSHGGLLGHGRDGSFDGGSPFALRRPLPLTPTRMALGAATAPASAVSGFGERGRTGWAGPPSSPLATGGSGSRARGIPGEHNAAALAAVNGHQMGSLEAEAAATMAAMAAVATPTKTVKTSTTAVKVIGRSGKSRSGSVSGGRKGSAGQFRATYISPLSGMGGFAGGDFEWNESGGGGGGGVEGVVPKGKKSRYVYPSPRGVYSCR